MDDAIDFAAEGLLDGLEGAARNERVELLTELVGRGLTLEEIKDAGTPLLLTAGRVVAGVPTLTAREMAEQSGTDLEFLQAVQRSNGLPIPDPDARVYTETDLHAIRITSAFLAAGVPRDDVLAVSRVLGRGLSQAADLMRAISLALVADNATSELEFADRYAEQVEILMPLVGPMLDQMMRAHLRNTVEAEMVNAAEQRPGAIAGARTIAVGFADLVGFTRLGERVGVDELERVAGRLEALTADHTTNPVRLVKTLGDGMLLVSTDPTALATQMLALGAAAEREGDDFPQLRIGLAYGQAVSRAGDWFGQPVNLASRVTAVARPGSVLAIEEFRDAVGDGGALDWSFAGARSLKGVRGEAKLFRARLTERDTV